jgi:colanic acid biosynthesis glycosyl transferase WcaI
VVITKGLGEEYLKQKKAEHGLDNLIILPFQPYEELPEVLASADVLLALLEKDARIFAVPSKVLTSLCAKRPLLLAVPQENLAARIVDKNEAGVVVEPDDVSVFLESAERLREDKKLREQMGKNGRKYAEEHFDIGKITDQFEEIIGGERKEKKE